MMKFAVSNIAWLPTEDDLVADFLNGTKFTGIEIAPSRYFKDVEKATEFEFETLRKHWLELGFTITSMQSLLFGRSDLQLFGNTDSRDNLLTFLVDLSRKAEILGAGPMVFGSPKNRIRGSLKVEAAKASGALFFQELALKWPSELSYLVLEANPEIYECDFVTKTSEALQFVNRVNRNTFKWLLDLACTEVSGESSVELIENSQTLPSHIHISEPYLAPLKIENIGLYRRFILALMAREYDGVVTLEMKNTHTFQNLFNSIKILDEVIP